MGASGPSGPGAFPDQASVTRSFALPVMLSIPTIPFVAPHQLIIFGIGREFRM